MLCGDPQQSVSNIQAITCVTKHYVHLHFHFCVGIQVSVRRPRNTQRCIKNPRKQPKKSAKTTFSRDWHTAKGDAKMSHPHHDKMMIADKNWYYNNMKKPHIIRRNQADPRKNISHLVVRVKVPAILYQPWPCRAESVFLHTRWPKHETMTQCWFDVGPSSTTLAQHQTNIGSTSRACWAWTWGLIFHALFVPRSCRTKMKTEACLIYMTCNWRCPDENEARTQSVSSAPPPPPIPEKTQLHPMLGLTL